MNIMTTENPRWDEFAETLSRVAQHCHHDHELAEQILAAMGGIDIPASLNYFRDRGGFCDCEICFNIIYREEHAV